MLGPRASACWCSGRIGSVGCRVGFKTGGEDERFGPPFRSAWKAVRAACSFRLGDFPSRRELKESDSASD